MFHVTEGSISKYSSEALLIELADRDICKWVDITDQVSCRFAVVTVMLKLTLKDFCPQRAQECTVP